MEFYSVDIKMLMSEWNTLYMILWHVLSMSFAYCRDLCAPVPAKLQTNIIIILFNLTLCETSSSENCLSDLRQSDCRRLYRALRAMAKWLSHRIC
jgi:hypothetical protein